MPDLGRCPACQRRLYAGEPCPLDGGVATVTPSGELPPPTLPGFTLQARLGRGGFAEVWSARDPGGREVALKLARGVDGETRARFAREAEALRAVGAPHVPALHAHGEHEGRAFLVLERLPGRSFAEWLAERGRQAQLPPFAEVAPLARGLAGALAAVHAAGVVHRDLKPENVMWDGARARLIDFGLARGGDDAELTRAGVVVGTEEYLAPERLEGAPGDASADVYAFGIVLFELLALRPPFVGDRRAVQLGHLALRPPRPRDDLPWTVAEALAACLAKSPARRPADLRVLVDALVAGETPLATPAPATPVELETRDRSAVLLAALGALPARAAAELVRRHGGLLARHRPERAIFVFEASTCVDPLASGLAAARELPGPAVLHLDRVSVRRGARTTVAGPAVDAPGWIPAEVHGLHVSEALRPLLPVSSPRATGPLVGREAELVALDAALAADAPTLVTIVGARGLGKSALLVEATARFAGEPAAAPTSFAEADVLRAAARQRRQLVVVDDGERLPAAALDALEYAALDGGGQLTIVLAAERLRPGFAARLPRHVALVLEPLEHPAALELARRALAPAEFVPEATLAALAAWAGHVPGAILAVGDVLVRDGVVRPRPGGGHHLAVGALDRLRASPAGEWLAARRLDDLPPALAGALRAAAVFAGDFSAAQLGALLPLMAAAARLDPDIAVRELRERGELAGDDAFRFADPALRDALAVGLDPRLHEAALAGATTLADRAYHALGAGRPEAATLHLALAEAAVAAQDWLAGEAAAGTALRLDPASWPALRLRARARLPQDRLAEADADLRAALALPGAPRAELLLDRSTVLDWMDDFAGSAAAGEEAATLTDGPRVALARGRSAWRRGELAAARDLLVRALAEADAADDEETAIIALLLLAPARVWLDDLPGAERDFEDVIRRTRAVDDVKHLASAYCNRMLLHEARADADATLADLRAALELSRRLGSSVLERRVTYNLAEFLFWHGDDDEALPLARRSLWLQEKFVAGQVALDRLLLCRVLLARGDDEVRAQLPRLIPESPVERLLTAAVAGVLGAPTDWIALTDEARGKLSPEEAIETLYWHAEALRRRGEDFAAPLAELRARAEARPIWRARLALLARAAERAVR